MKCQLLLIWILVFAGVELVGSPRSFAGTLSGGGGGGNGTGNRIYESYVRDPLKLPAMKLIEPLLDHARQAARAAGEDDTRASTDFAPVFRMKSWYFVPQNLVPISKARIGVTFLKGTTQQVARQTDEAVWIDSKIFDRMTLVDQADLLLHEAMMTLYMRKFSSLSSLCRRMQRASLAQAKDCTPIESFEPLVPHPPELSTYINKHDIENIRGMVLWLKAQGTSASNAEIRAAYLRFGFDSRMFDDGPTVDDSMVVKSPEALTSFRRAEMVGRLPSVCHRRGIRGEAACRLSLFEDTTPTPWYPLPLPIWRVEVRDSHGGILAQTWASPTSETSLQLLPNPVTNDKLFASFGIQLNFGAKVGDRFTHVVYIWKKIKVLDESRLELQAMIFVPAVTTSINPQHQIAMGEALKTGRPEDAIVYVTTPELANVLPRLFINAMFPFQVVPPKQAADPSAQ